MPTAIVATVGMNVVACPACREINFVTKREVAHGTAFIPMTGTEVARARCGHDIEKTAGCSDRGHTVVVMMIGSRSAPIPSEKERQS